MPAYCIMHTKSLEAIADTMPRSPDELVGLSSIGPKRAEKYGNEIIGIVDSFARLTPAAMPRMGNKGRPRKERSEGLSGNKEFYT